MVKEITYHLLAFLFLGGSKSPPTPEEGILEAFGRGSFDVLVKKNPKRVLVLIMQPGIFEEYRTDLSWIALNDTICGT